MIPEKIYYCDGCGAMMPSYIANDCQDAHGKAIEYTRTPGAKRFSDEKPKNAGRYFVKYKFPSGALSEWVLDTLYEDGVWDFKYSEPYLWSEIILPVIKE